MILKLAATKESWDNLFQDPRNKEILTELESLRSGGLYYVGSEDVDKLIKDLGIKFKKPITSYKLAGIINEHHKYRLVDEKLPGLFGSSMMKSIVNRLKRLQVRIY